MLFSKGSARARCGLWLIVLAGSLALGPRPVRADTLSSQSSVGVSAEYDSNPFLLPSGVQSAESLAAVANVPLTYTSDTQTIDLIPRLRLGETNGPVALLSNYEYLDGDWHWTSERNTLVVTGEWHHDSTLYNQFENAELLGHDLGRLEQSGSLAWQRALTELSDVQLTGSWDQVAYSHNSASSLTNFSYAQGALEYDRTLSERWQWSTAAGYGQYRLLDGSYLSNQRFARTTVSLQWSELWSGMAEVGYAYLSAHTQGEVCCELQISPSGELYYTPVPFVQVSSRGSPSYALTAKRQGERLGLDLALSRAIQPTGLGALLTQDDASVKASLPWTERLTVGGTLHWSRLTDTLDRLNLQQRYYYEVDLNASWQWTEYWSVGLETTLIQDSIGPRVPQSQGATVYLTLSRQFGRLRL